VEESKPIFVSRAGEKLRTALDAFSLDVRGFVCADFGCNVGGFTDCLLQRGAAKVFAVDTGYGELAWKLRKDPRVVVMERTNALYTAPPQPVDLVVIDVAWTPQELAVPAAMKWLRKPDDDAGRFVGVVSLLKPHYEYAKLHGKKPVHVLSDEESLQVCRQVCDKLAAMGCRVENFVPSGLRGKGGNVEYLLLIPIP
jgi:23S rRNA (cytidine1920-2'-O)/16S rRNA (cytidine1409-2'-O)-methyltransferase